MWSGAPGSGAAGIGVVGIGVVGIRTAGIGEMVKSLVLRFTMLIIPVFAEVFVLVCVARWTVGCIGSGCLVVTVSGTF